MKGLFEDHLQIVGKVLDLRLQRQNVVMSNLANINTPGYRSKKLHFEEDLQAALDLDARGKMARTSMEHMPSVFDAETFGAGMSTDYKPRVVYGDDAVDLDKEMAVLGKNTMMYDALLTVIKKNFEGLKQIISEAKS